MKHPKPMYNVQKINKNADNEWGPKNKNTFLKIELQAQTDLKVQVI